jgi:hypothetical protein
LGFWSRFIAGLWLWRLELKTAEEISKAHEAQLTHYLRACAVEVGVILNFGPVAKVRRMEFRNERKRLVGAGVPAMAGCGLE